MAGITDTLFRGYCKEFGADVVVTEFVAAEGIFRRNARTLEYRIVPNQIGLFGDTRWTYYGDRLSRVDVNNFQFRAGVKFVF